VTEDGWNVAERQGDLEIALREIDWTDAFVSEASAVSPSRLLPDGSVAAAEALADVRVSVVAPCGRVSGVELHLHQARWVSVPFDRDVRVTAEVHRTEVLLFLAPRTNGMRGRALRWRLVARSEAERVGRYGREYPEGLDEIAELWHSRG
jgi:hypothetical protein